MAPVPRGGVVAVTGAAGFIGGWVVRRLLDRGYRVRACVRRPDDETKTGFLKAMGAYASGRLTLHAADLSEPASFEAAFRGAHGVAHVAHVASEPAADGDRFQAWTRALQYQDQSEIERICAGLIDCVERSGSVRRVVVTSSIAAIMSEADIDELVRRPVIYEDRTPDETNPRRSADRGQGYSMGKVLAEKLFSDAAAASGRFDSITCCPGDNVGPIQSRHQKDAGPWQHLVEQMLLGVCEQNGAYRPWMPVDVRDDADCHVALLESVAVRNGERFIAFSAERRNVEQVAEDVRRLFPELGLAPAELRDGQSERTRSREAELRAIWAQVDLRNDRMRAATGVEFRPFDVTLRDCVESLLSIGAVSPKRA